MTKIPATVLLLLGAASMAIAGGPGFGFRLVPEIDASSVVSAATLLSGALLLIRAGRKAPSNGK